MRNGVANPRGEAPQYNIDTRKVKTRLSTPGRIDVIDRPAKWWLEYNCIRAPTAEAKLVFWVIRTNPLF